MASIFRKVLVDKRLPKKDDIYYHTDVGFIDFDLKNGWMDCNKDPEYPTWWLEEKELPSDDEIKIVAQAGYSQSHNQFVFSQGIKWLKEDLLADPLWKFIEL